MRILSISQALEQRREAKYQEARAILEKLAEIHSIKQSPEIYYDKARKQINHSQKTMDSKNFSSVIRKLDNFLFDRGIITSYAFRKGRNVPPLENNLKRLRLRRSSSLLERWCRDVKPLIEDLLTRNPETMGGFEFTTYEPLSNIAYSSGIYNNKVVFENGKLGISFKDSEESIYGEPDFYKMHYQDLALDILKSLEPRKGYSFFILKDESERSEVINELVHRRNYLIKEVKKRTRRDLKKEVAILNKNN